MDRVYVRTCSADQASVLSAAAGRCTQVRSSRIRIHRPSGRMPIDPSSPWRYVARIEVLESEPVLSGAAGEAVADVVSDLFGPYLD